MAISFTCAQFPSSNTCVFRFYVLLVFKFSLGHGSYMLRYCSLYERLPFFISYCFKILMLLKYLYNISPCVTSCLYTPQISQRFKPLMCHVIYQPLQLIQ